MRTAGGIADIDAYGIDTASPITHGLVHRAPRPGARTADEVALSPSALTRLGAQIGSAVTTQPGARSRSSASPRSAARIEDSMLFAPDRAIARRSGDWLIEQPSPLLIDRDPPAERRRLRWLSPARTSCIRRRRRR